MDNLVSSNLLINDNFNNIIQSTFRNDEKSITYILKNWQQAFSKKQIPRISLHIYEYAFLYLKLVKETEANKDYTSLLKYSIISLPKLQIELSPTSKSPKINELNLLAQPLYDCLLSYHRGDKAIDLDSLRIDTYSFIFDVINSSNLHETIYNNEEEGLIVAIFSLSLKNLIKKETDEIKNSYIDKLEDVMFFILNKQKDNITNYLPPEYNEIGKTLLPELNIPYKQRLAKKAAVINHINKIPDITNQENQEKTYQITMSL